MCSIRFVVPYLDELHCERLVTIVWQVARVLFTVRILLELLPSN